MAELPHLHEAAILYQVKERHVLENRIRAWVRLWWLIPVNGLRVFHQEQEKYAKILVWQEGTLHCIVLYCIHCIVWQDGRAALVTIEVTNYSQHEFSLVSTDILGARRRKEGRQH
jgi:hypothetical protein